VGEPIFHHSSAASTKCRWCAATSGANPEDRMNAECRRIYETGVHVGNFSTAQPDTDAGHLLLVGKAKELTARMEQVAAAQRDGLVDSRAASAEKEKLRRTILAGPIAHLAQVGRLAAREEHELGTTFRFRPGAKTFVAFRTTARSMQAEAEGHKEVLAKYGLSEAVLGQLGQLLDQFDTAVTLGSDGRTAHIGATKQLRALATELRQVVRAMDARNRQRFENDPQLLGSWISAKTVRSGRRASSEPGETPGQGGDVRPAA
jgi:hypothetical protein